MLVFRIWIIVGDTSFMPCVVILIARFMQIDWGASGGISVQRSHPLQTANEWQWGHYFNW